MKTQDKTKIYKIISIIMIILSIIIILTSLLFINNKEKNNLNKETETQEEKPIKKEEEKNNALTLIEIGTKMYNDKSYENYPLTPNHERRVMTIGSLKNRGIDITKLINPKCTPDQEIISFYDDVTKSPGNKNVVINANCVLKK